jgi:hypothetical protein
MSDIDEKILLCVHGGRTTFSAIRGAFPLSLNFRVIDRRLQSLRKRGLLTYTRKEGWKKP